MPDLDVRIVGDFNAGARRQADADIRRLAAAAQALREQSRAFDSPTLRRLVGQYGSTLSRVAGDYRAASTTLTGGGRLGADSPLLRRLATDKRASRRTDEAFYQHIAPMLSPAERQRVQVAAQRAQQRYDQATRPR